MAPGTEFARDVCAGIGPLQLGIVLVYIMFTNNSSQLQVSWMYPTADVAQVYECHVTGVTHTGSRDVTSSVHVTSNDVTMDVLVSPFICSCNYDYQHL